MSSVFNNWANIEANHTIAVKVRVCVMLLFWGPSALPPDLPWRYMAGPNSVRDGSRLEERGADRSTANASARTLTFSPDS